MCPGGMMESTETIQYAIHPLRDGYFIEETWFSHTIGNDYWLGRTDSEERTYLSDRWDDALRKAEDQMDQK